MKPTEEQKLEAKLMHRYRKALKEFELIEDGDRVLIGLSGGKNRIHGHIAELCIICQDAKVKLGTVIFNITDKLDSTT